MSVVNSKSQPQQTFSGRLQSYWEHPHPYGLIAMLKSALDGIEDAANGSIAATGVSPSTEEEAFRVNQMRDRGAVGAFHAASTFGPAAPEWAQRLAAIWQTASYLKRSKETFRAI